MQTLDELNSTIVEFINSAPCFSFLPEEVAKHLGLLELNPARLRFLAKNERIVMIVRQGVQEFMAI